MSRSNQPKSPDESGSPPGPFPVPDATLPFWRTDLHQLDTHRSTAELPQKCDVLIIGSGLSGAATAYHILDNNPSPPSMVILEARQACSGATARNGGHVKPDLYYRVPQYVRLYGKQAAADMALFEMNHVQAVKDLVEKESIDCDFVLTRAFDVILDPELAKKTKKEFDQLVSEGFPTIKDVWYAPAAAAQALTGVKDAQCAFSFTVASLWPYKLVTHLLSLAVKRGVNLQTHTPVTSVSETQDAHGYWLVTTPRGVIKAKKIIFATNGYTAGIVPQFREKIIPVRGICSRIAVPTGKEAPSLPFSYSVRHNDKGADYQITRPDGSIIVGGGRPAYWHKGNEWYNIHDDSQMIRPAVSYFNGLMQRTYRGWEDSGAAVDKIWTGILGYTNDLVPYAGAVPAKGGQFICAGFNGHGMPAILLTSKGIAKMIREGCAFEETGVPRPFKVTAARLQNPTNAIMDMVNY
ncbi:unnamed protein product [Clonostachys rosea]|uniref:FAD dependent oxidoreductase domain-containing protein n=1 Tax=Bionectria ochroleuca TaxID=29856 RepID=A0ABY6U1I2_BIOOC|nr:unnamed protein product [Clonostachys rosea]